MDEYVQLRQQISTPMVLAQVQIHAPLLSLQKIADMGYSFALFSVTGLQVTVTALQGVADEMMVTGFVGQEPLSTFSNVKEVVGFQDLEDFEKEYYCE